MIDLTGVPDPPNAPEPGTCVRIERPEAGLAVLYLDPPHRPSIAVFDAPLLRDLDRALDELIADTSLKGLVITGRDPLTFAAGADVETIASVSDPIVARRFCSEGQALFQRLHKLGRKGGGKVSTVAAVGGPVPGGACEIALACDRIVLADDKKSRIGLPEVLLGIIPAWGGSQRMPRRIGLPAALESILSGKLHVARKAYRLGLVDRLAKPEYLLRVARDIAMGRMTCTYRGRAGVKKGLIDKNPLIANFIEGQARKSVMAKTHGHYPAPLAALPLVAHAARTPLERGLEKEADAIQPLTSSGVSRSLVSLFLLSEEAKKLGNLPDGSKASSIRRAAVIGAGVMGGGIAGLMAEKRVATRLRDLDQRQLDAAVGAHQAEIEKKRKRRSLERHEADAALDRLEVTTRAEGFSRCELVVEAVAERLDVKLAVLGEMARLMGPDAILATNTSSLSVTEIAAGLPHPERVVGMHFFNPPRKMPLVEIVRGEKTSDEVVARTARLAVDLGKTPVVTTDVAGFLVNRVLGPYLDEAVRMLAGGADPEAVDRALVAFGMPMGPYELIDEVGLDIAGHAGASLEKAYGERMKASTALAPLIEVGDLGKKTGRGIYLWKKGKRGRLERAGRNPKAPKSVGTTGLSSERIVDRLVLAMVNEAARALEEGVVVGPRQLDLATVFGTGFAPFRGGVLRYADTRGAQEIVERLGSLKDQLASEGERSGRFEAAPLLLANARHKTRFHD